MILEGIATVLIAATAISDVVFTNGRLRKYGPEVELNARVVRNYRRFGVLGLCLTILVPTAVLTALALLAHQVLFLGVILGVRLCLFDFQRTSRELERAIDTLKKSGGVRTPSSDSLDTFEGEK